MVILVISNIMAWWQLNAQFTETLKGHWFWSNANWMALFGIPIGWLFFHATRLSYEHFGQFWNIRLMGFGVGTIVFGLITWILMNEAPTLKTVICLMLAAAIVMIQITNVIE